MFLHSKVAGRAHVCVQCPWMVWLVVVAAGANDVGIVPIRNRLRRLHFGHNLLEQAVALRLVDAEPPPLAKDGAGATHGLIQRPLLIHDAHIHHDHGRDASSFVCSPARGAAGPLLLLQHPERGDRRRHLLHLCHDAVKMRLCHGEPDDRCGRLLHRPSSPPPSSEAVPPLCVVHAGIASRAQGL